MDATALVPPVAKAGVFPNKNRPRVFWTGISGDVTRLAKMAREIEDEFGRLNVPPENRRFSPHLTLARAEPVAGAARRSVARLAEGRLLRVELAQPVEAGEALATGRLERAATAADAPDRAAGADAALTLIVAGAVVAEGQVALSHDRRHHDALAGETACRVVGRDLDRVLRVPGYLHLKDPTDPFLVKHVWGPYPATYTEREMIACFPPSREELEPRAPKPTQPLDVRGSGFWDRVFDLDCGEALLRLSGHRAVNGETYKLRPMSNGNRNVLVNGKSTSCWVDRNGRIGSHSRGGPSILRWLQWFNLSTAEAAEVIKEVFPEVAND